ncbi:RlmE family RNA methyltransferase [Ferrovibrio sp.]|uniref:RlmE family RNA methyltransferase n=1 Tax=Ferrovibrio sp. TaxID=1917215 RepID=UPI0035B1A796
MHNNRGGGGRGGSRGGGRDEGTVTGRGLTTRVKTAHKRSLSSTMWLNRQLNDPYVAEAKKRGYRSRAAFKILQLDEKFHFFKIGGRVVDLGAAPGGWTQVAVDRVHSADGRGKVIGIDLQAVEPIPGATIIQLDFMDASAPDKLKALLEGEADVVLSDMAASSTGHAQTDHLKIIDLAETALHFACEVLAPGGTFIAKVLQGGATNELLAQLKKHFGNVKHVKPDASRKDSAEIYVVALGFRK